MNKDQVKGSLKDVGGKIQREFGDAVDSREQEAKGLKNQVEGKTQKELGDTREELNDANDTKRRDH